MRSRTRRRDQHPLGPVVETAVTTPGHQAVGEHLGGHRPATASAHGVDACCQALVGLPLLGAQHDIVARAALECHSPPTRPTTSSPSPSGSRRVTPPPPFELILPRLDSS